MTDRVMVDIETLGLDPGAAILSIGAVRFDTDGLGATFERNIGLESCQEAGLTIDAGTLEWWLQQDADAQHVLTGGESLVDALEALAEFYAFADEI
jgi:DNA polymerase III epsilon subunit-like protein